MASSSSAISVTTRSRSLLFFSYRESAARPRFSRARQKSSATHLYGPTEAAALDYDDDERQGLIPSSSSSPPGRPARHVALDIHLPPKWVDISDQVEDLIVAVQPKILALDKLHAKHVLPGFTDRSAEEREIQLATSDITRDFRQCHSLIQRISPGTSEHAFPPSHSSKHATLAAQNVQRALAAKVQELSGTFRKKQRVYMEKLQGHAIKNQDILVASGAISLKGPEGMSALEEDVMAVSELHQRNRELNEIAKSITSLAELFKDLSSLVIDQGTILDSVEYNVEQTSINVEEAVKELNIATRYQKNTGRRKCIFLLILIIIGLVLVLIFKPHRQNVEPAPPPSSPSPTLLPLSSASLARQSRSRVPRARRSVGSRRGDIRWLEGE
ncbi:t-SNARE [Ramaria rubella]|nr:t-SNARE [Ramaria rubella]